jgi:hypothetical protein
LINREEMSLTFAIQAKGLKVFGVALSDFEYAVAKGYGHIRGKCGRLAQ